MTVVGGALNLSKLLSLEIFCLLLNFLAIDFHLFCDSWVPSNLMQSVKLNICSNKLYDNECNTIAVAWVKA